VNVDQNTWREVDPADSAPPALDELASAETNDELSAALGQLAPNQRRVLLLRFFGALTFEEIAATMGCPLSTALSHARRGLATLKKLLTTTNGQLIQ
jgi:RNA polymerase sigma factor (sigma-70 family)